MSVPFLDVVIGGILGLLIGSFLNVVIYRLPKMMERQWAAEHADYAGTPPPGEPVFNLMHPKSHCQKCGHRIRWFENIPILSFLFLRGKCADCATPISLRYPLVEFATALLFAYCIWRWGITWTGIAWCGFGAAIVTASMIDWDTTLLPDDITLPLMWVGILLSSLNILTTPLSNSIWGAVAGYVSLWLVYWAFKFFTGKEGMGYGDFKLFAALGAWFGWQALIPIILMASVTGALIGITLKFASRLRGGGYVPFGPFLGIAGLATMFFGPQAVLHVVGLV